MTAYIIRRLLWFIPVLVVVGLVTFTMAQITPGGPFDRNPEQGRRMNPGTERVLRAKFGMDLPVWRQFLRYMFFDVEKDTKTGQNKVVWGAISGNLGPTYRSQGRRTVQDEIFKGTKEKPSKFYYSARLGIQAFIFALLIGVPLGVLAALKQNTWIDYIVLFTATAFYSLSSLILGYLLLLVFASWLNWFTVLSNWDDPIRPWILPTLTLGLSSMGYIARIARSSVLEVKRQDYVRTARAKGLADMRVVWGHIVKNALLPIITISGPMLAGLVTGTLFTELIFQVPGMGRDFVAAVGARDYSMILGMTLFYCFILILMNLIVDLLYGVADPRISLS
ncbi:ABC transporter permease [Chloroflexia bacterium SDU3-3]|nr:ABC transporter permease [Chloroflexia bacterium SDU3-3]